VVKNSGFQDESGSFYGCADRDLTEIHIPRVHRRFLGLVSAVIRDICG
jgi:hypothetical protein